MNLENRLTSTEHKLHELKITLVNEYEVLLDKIQANYTQVLQKINDYIDHIQNIKKTLNRSIEFYSEEIEKIIELHKIVQATKMLKENGVDIIEDPDKLLAESCDAIGWDLPEIKIDKNVANSIKLSKPTGILSLKLTEISCGHDISSMFISSCRKVLCRGCIRSKYPKKQNALCICNKPLSRKDLDNIY
jgi:hypothetical protein